MKNGTSLKRFSICMPANVARQLDVMVKAKGYENRSQALTDMVRAQIVEYQSETDNHEIAGTITLVYDHHKPKLLPLLTGIQHDHQELIVATMHVHLDHHNCMEVLALRGRAGAIKQIADKLIATKGVKHGKLTVTTTAAGMRR